MNSAPVWIDQSVVEAMHNEQIAEHGGAGGLRDAGLLESALARPLNMLTYGKPTLFDLAAAYAMGILRNHPFVDGNKRTAFLTAYVFLRLNGWRLLAAVHRGLGDQRSRVLAMARSQRAGGRLM